MSSSSEKNLSPPRWRVALAGAVGGSILAAVAAVYLWPPAPEPPSPLAMQAPPAARFGPGAWVERGTDAPLALLNGAPDGLAVTEDQHLLINQALHDVIDFFLLSGQPGGRSAQKNALFSYLNGKLPPVAGEEAAQIVLQYLAYMDQHDSLLARQALPASSPDGAIASQYLERIAIWQEQRSWLRQSVLGLQVAQSWYGDEDAQLRQAMAVLSNAAAPGSDAGASRPTRMRGAMRDALSERDARTVLATSTKSFTALASEVQGRRQ
ncbi:MAG: hypothetical protein V4488_22560 [Pseudomonadota bacterium]